jgi:creatinine amidohydrolase
LGHVYAKLTWQEIREAARAGHLVLMPTGTLEDHGAHLPVDTDVVIADHICQRVAQRRPDVVLMPPVVHGHSPHHIDHSAAVSIRWDHMVDWLTDITDGLVHHGFRRFLFVNGHGSNAPVLDLAARLTNVHSPESRCATISWWELSDVRAVMDRVRESAWSGHADEFETSAYLSIDASAVHMERAEAEHDVLRSEHVWDDLGGRPGDALFKNPVHLVEWWSANTANGVYGDPTVATAHKGGLLLEAAVGEIDRICGELLAREIRQRRPRQFHVEGGN